MSHQLLGELEKKLADFGFFRIHKSYLINLPFISELFAGSGNGLSVHMKGYERRELPVGREKLKTLKTAVEDQLTEREAAALRSWRKECVCADNHAVHADHLLNIVQNIL